MISTMMYNSCPGVNFRACDMVRNLVLSTYMSQPLAVQEKTLRASWLMPFEIPYKDKMDAIMTAFVDQFERKGRYISGMEKQMIQVSQMIPSSFKGFMLYAKFVSLYESRTMNLPEDEIES